MARCVLVRPGETDYDREGRISGTLDLPLNESGEDGLDAIIEAVRATQPDAVLTSPQDPARSTAKAVAKELGVPLKELDDLVNIDQGLWEGRLFEEIRQRQPKLYKQWAETPECVTPPEGESCTQAAERVQSALRKPLKKYDTFVVVAAEPLATLVKTVIQSERPQIGKPQTDPDSIEHVEVVEVVPAGVR